MTKPRKKPAEDAAPQTGAEAISLQPGVTLAVVPGAIAAFSKTEAGLAELRGRLAGVVFDVTTTEGMKTAREARRELVTLRTTLEDARRDEKSDLLKRGRLIDDEAKRVRALIVEIEQPIDDQIIAEEGRKAKAREESIRAERAEGVRVQGVLDGLRNFPIGLAGKSADLIAAGLEELRGRECTDVPEDTRPEAILIRDAAIDRLIAMYAERVEFEREQAEHREAKRDSEFRDRIATIRTLPSDLYDEGAARISNAADRLEGENIAAEMGWPAHLVEEARQARDITLQRLRARAQEKLDAFERDAKERIQAERVKKGRELIAEVNAAPSKIIAQQCSSNDIAQRISFLESLESPDMPEELSAEYQAVFETALLAMRTTFGAVKRREDADQKRADEERERAERDQADEIARASLVDTAADAAVALHRCRCQHLPQLLILKLESAIERERASQPVRQAARKKAAAPSKRVRK